MLVVSSDGGDVGVEERIVDGLFSASTGTADGGEREERAEEDVKRVTNGDTEGRMVK